METKLYQLYDNELNLVKKVKSIDKKIVNQSYQLTIGIILLLVGIALVSLGSVWGFYKTHTISKVDKVRYTSPIYSQWMRGVPVADTVIIPLKKLNKKVYLDIKDSVTADINIILPLASTLKNGDYIELQYRNDLDHVDQVFYFFENLVSSIFVEGSPDTYFLNNIFKIAKLKVVNNKWTIAGSGIL